jgi:hypothetical protein
MQLSNLTDSSLRGRGATISFLDKGEGLLDIGARDCTSLDEPYQQLRSDAGFSLVSVQDLSPAIEKHLAVPMDLEETQVTSRRRHSPSLLGLGNFSSGGSRTRNNKERCVMLPNLSSSTRRGNWREK